MSMTQTIHIEGGIVPVSLLSALAEGTLGSDESRSPESFGLSGGHTISDAVNRSWSWLTGAWRAWRDSQAKEPKGLASTNAALARDRWLLPLLQELGYGKLSPGNGIDLPDGKHYPVSHAWSNVPIHLLGPGVDLDHRNTGVQGAARAPQAMLQELLNRSDTFIWAILSNGLKLRLLRDSTALAGSAYIEFDLEAIFEGELFSDFMVLWQLCHVSRLEPRLGPEGEESSAQCWLELWREDSIRLGTRALDRLRIGVEKAIQHLGTGFIADTANAALRSGLGNGAFSGEDYHRHLLRLVYRILFLFVAEDRDVLLDPASDTAARERYISYFSTKRLRQQAYARQGSLHFGDLWQAFVLVLKGLGGEGVPQLGIPALGGLFDPEDGGNDPLLDCSLSNFHLLAAIRDLGWVQTKQGLQAVDYRNLGAEELGSVYESLLELMPRVTLAEQKYELVAVSGNDRKTTGSYYTPSSLVSALLDTALDPVIDNAVKAAGDAQDAERHLLDLTICDPACGSGHFLVAGARRLAHRLAAIRSGEDEPTPGAVRHALRDVVSRCVYGVDLNPLAAELAKVSLWLEAIEPGKPLGFLDARIRVGNSLLGATPALLEGGLPDEAFDVLDGDDKKVAAAARKRNKAERQVDRFGGQGQLELAPVSSSTPLVKDRRALLGTYDDVDQVREQADRWREYEQSDAYRAEKLKADAWLAAFVWPLTDAYTVPTSATLEQLSANPDAEHLADFRAGVVALSNEYRFFHWHVEFSEVFDKPGDIGPEGWAGGFDAMIGNPPWDLIELKEQEYFASYDSEIAEASGAKRKKLITGLKTVDPMLFDQYRREKRHVDATRKYLGSSGRFPLTGRGRINTYSVFAELFSTLVAPTGQAGVIVPTGIATDATTQYYFKSLVTHQRIRSLYDFENAAPIFDGVHRSFKFCLLTLAGRKLKIAQPQFAFFLHDANDIAISSFTMTPEEIMLVNPNTGTLPIFRTRRDAEITLGIYRRVPVLIKEDDPDGNPWGISFMQGLFNMTSDSNLFYTREELEADGWVLNGNVFERQLPDKPENAGGGGISDRNSEPRWERMMPLYEAKMIHHYDTRWATYEPDGSTRLMAEEEKARRLLPMPRYWVHEDEISKKVGAKWDKSWLLAYRLISNTTNERTVVASMIPRVGAGNSLCLLFLNNKGSQNRHMLQAALSSFAYDYVARQSMGGSNLNFFVFQQLPVPRPGKLPDVSMAKPVGSWLATVVDRLNGWTTTPEVRAYLRAELDALMFHVYGLSRADAGYIMETFPIVKRKDETAYGEYRTKRLILQAYDAMAAAIATGNVYESPFEEA